jgi:hypothetical protein
MPKLLTSQDSYFEPDGEFKKKYGTFADTAIMGEHLSDLINGRSPEHAEKFEENINSLTQAFEKNPTAEKAFYHLVDECRAFGLVQMALRRAKHSHYHTTEHAAELADDIEQGLTEKFKTEFPQDKSNNLFIALAKAAASWHDIVQDRGVPPNNEVESAAQFVTYMNELLENYKKKFNFMTPAIENFQRELDFLSKELIVYGTWLVFGMEPGMKLVAKTLTERALYVIQDVNAKSSAEDKTKIAETPNMRRLYGACEMISNGDTKRFGMEHVLKDQLILKALRNFPPANLKILNNFFIAAGINDDRVKEQFLGLMCQNIRIFPELNKPENSQSSVNNSSGKLISEAEHDSYVKVCDDIKASASYTINKNATPKTHAMFNNFMYAENLQGKNNISREISFAKAQQDPMWDLHAKHLNDFTNYIKKISANEKDLLAETLIVLATRFQPGNYLLKKDKTFHAQLREVEKWQKQVLANKADNKVAPLSVTSIKKLTPSQSATAFVFSTAGLKTYSLPSQAKMNLNSALSRFGTSYFSNIISRFSSRRTKSDSPDSMQYKDKPPSSVIKNIFKVDPSKLVSASKSEPSSVRERASSDSNSKSYLESRNRAESNSVFKPNDTPPGYKKSQRHISHKIEESDDSDILNRPKK